MQWMRSIGRCKTPAFAAATIHSATRGLYDAGVRGVDSSVKVNHQFKTKDLITGRYAYSRGRLLNAVQGPDDFSDRSAFGSSLTADHSLGGDWMHVFSPALFND